MCTLVIIWLILKAQQFSFSFQIQYVLIIIHCLQKVRKSSYYIENKLTIILSFVINNNYFSRWLYTN